MKLPTFKHIPGDLSTQEMLEYNDDIGVHTYGMWIIKAAEDPNLVLVTREYDDRTPLLPAWKISVSDAPWRVEPLNQAYPKMWFNHTGIDPQNLEILPYFANAPIEDGHFAEDRSFPLMPVVGNASVEDDRADSTEWYWKDSLRARLQESMSGNSLYSPYMQLCLQGLQLARNYRAAQLFVESTPQ